MSFQPAWRALSLAPNRHPQPYFIPELWRLYALGQAQIQLFLWPNIYVGHSFEDNTVNADVMCLKMLSIGEHVKESLSHFAYIAKYIWGSF